MANWQEKIGNTIKGVTNRQEAFVNRVQQGITLTGDTMERLAGFQIGLATDGADAAIAQVKLLGQPGTPVTYLKQQVGFVADGVRGAKSRATELRDLTRDGASDAVALFGFSGKKKTTSRAKTAS